MTGTLPPGWDVERGAAPPPALRTRNAMTDFVRRLRHRLIPAVPAIFDAEGRLDVPANERYAAWMARQDVGAVAIWAHTGRGLYLSDEQRHRVLQSWRTVLGDTPILCGVGTPARVRLPAAASERTARVTRATVDVAARARDAGAQAVMVHPPSALGRLKDWPQRVVELHQAVAEVGLPVLAFYLYEAAGGLAYSPDTVENLLGIPGVVGIKIATLDSVMTFQDLVPVVRNEPAALLITGEDRFLGYSLMLGADSALIGIAAACTDVAARLLDAWFARDVAAFLELSARVDAFARATFTAPMEGYVQRLLWALQADGVLSAAAVDPFTPALDPVQRGLVAAAVMALRLA